MALCRPKFGRNVFTTLKNRQKKFYDIWFDFGSQKKKIVKMDKILEISAKK
jgi:hypothetical protein